MLTEVKIVLLLDKSSVELWKMLLPKKYILSAKDHSYEELIFRYRNHVYFVHEDGSVVRMNKPDLVEKYKAEDLWELLFHDRDTFDYDDHGIFTIGEILQDMSFLVPMSPSKDQLNFQVEIVESYNLEKVAYCFELSNVSFTYALYQALMTCSRLDLEKNSEYEVLQIIPLEYPVDKTEQL